MNPRISSQVVREIVDRSLWGDRDLMLVDVGASGGVAEVWNAFLPRFSAVGFDPLVENMRRVSAAEKRPRVRYESAFVQLPDYDAMFPVEERRVRIDPYLRTSAAAAHEKHKFDYVARVFNESDDVRWSTRITTLDDYFAPGTDIDFLKIDTDGSDYQVLLGSERLLREGAFLGIVIEAQFQGWPHDYANVFANIDRHLRARGFALYDLDTFRYTRAALPGLFVYDIPAQTRTGQVLWGDVLYFRDIAHPEYQRSWQYTVTRERLLKMVALFDFYDLPDCAAEVLLAHPSLTTDAERARLLDLLVVSAGFDTDYEDHVRRFETDLESLFPRHYGLAVSDLITERRIARKLHAQNAVLKDRVAQLKQRLIAEREKRRREKRVAVCRTDRTESER